ncbi:mitochondrial ribosomal death-associated protein 3-domain-containing protein [Amanita rubescens]|nr:mitochondrial ribosomal death-associated protein 3-domain-containing protein [Amanita rubescens]
MSSSYPVPPSSYGASASTPKQARNVELDDREPLLGGGARPASPGGIYEQPAPGELPGARKDVMMDVVDMSSMDLRHVLTILDGLVLAKAIYFFKQKRALEGLMGELRLGLNVELNIVDKAPARSTLADLINVGLKDAAVLDALINELGRRKTHPVLLAVDDFRALYCKTAYRDPFFNPIRPYHLSMPRLIMEYASGGRTFAKGKGAVLGAITYSDPAYPLPLRLREALQIPYNHPQSPYDKCFPTLIEYTN